MRRPGLAPFFLMAFSIGRGADTAPPDPTAKTETIATPAPPPRTISVDTAARVAAGLPKFVPRQATGAATAPPSPVGGEIDAPRNGIVRLPNYDVRERPLPKFSQREMLTAQGRSELALKRHPGLKFGPFASLNVGWGLAMLAEEQAHERALEMAELTDFVHFIETELPRDPTTGQRTAAPKAPSK